ncbi:hypothetical protein [Acholeplasma hippikon]|uniref:Uncharacterized distant relative of cell wall-associated hydrolases n=1 Tax=Acholeplasma hippikon TaxID=264636 RepID=A0A449BKT9_9MOLU|nr:hypothetical protein [Acholeplasma hippikon]VEU83040.1 Uncharacterized distant relative of cell wall-associated hydrolases [Acholeplasma hippikon]
MKRKKRIRIKKIFKLILIITLIGFMYSIGVSTYEAILKQQKLDEFKNRAYETEIRTLYGQEYQFHKVKRVHDYELADKRNVFYDDNKLSPGKKGDVLLAFESPFPQIPVAHHLVTFYFGGHAALVADNNTVIESTGMSSGGIKDMIKAVLHRGYDEENELNLSVQQVPNYWMSVFRHNGEVEYPYYGKYYRNEFYAVRTKFEDIDKREEHIDLAVEFASDKVDRGLYNYLFFLDTKYKFYCTDLVTRAYASINKLENTNYNLNEDGFISSDYDILLSSDTYITIYKETKGDVIHIYYLEDVA